MTDLNTIEEFIYMPNSGIRFNTDLIINGEKITTAADFERVKAQLARLDNVEGLAKFLHNREMSVDISEREGLSQEEYIDEAQAVINYIKGV